MKTYLVGGAVRDLLLGYPVTERDWVVVGCTPDYLLKQGFHQVGLDFPVFLHPKTREEYALARTERKQGQGYLGFICDANSNITLEEDLIRRDLTINAMAMDTNNNLIDPYHGSHDLADKCLRHVSSAFVEDPLRVLRVARFHARYHHLGFYVADETLALMKKIACSGELNSLVADRVWKEWSRSLSEKNPECFLQTLSVCGALACILPEIILSPKLIDILRQVTRRTTDPVIRFAALLSQCDHIKDLCKRLHVPNEYCELANKVFALSDQIARFESLSAKQKLTILETADAFRRPQLFEKILIACEAARCSNQINDRVTDSWRQSHMLCSGITAAPFIQNGIKGPEITNNIRGARELMLRNKYEKQ